MYKSNIYGLNTNKGVTKYGKNKTNRVIRNKNI